MGSMKCASLIVINIFHTVIENSCEATDREGTEHFGPGVRNLIGTTKSGIETDS